MRPHMRLLFNTLFPDLCLLEKKEEDTLPTKLELSVEEVISRVFF